MSGSNKIKVSEVTASEVSLIGDYWFNADAAYLKGMGADKHKLPTREDFAKMLHNQLSLPYSEKAAYALIWKLDDVPVGHSNINAIKFGTEAKMHLHVWHGQNRKSGFGSKFVLQSMPFYFQKFNLQKLICEPYALNPAPNKTMEKLGFSLIKRYTTIPGSINFEQEVNRWEMTKEQFEAIKLKDH